MRMHKTVKTDPRRRLDVYKLQRLKSTLAWPI